MTITFDPSTDFADIADHLEPVTLRRRGNGATSAIAGALRRGISQSEVASSDGKYLTSDVRWHLADADLSTTPEVGDYIVDAAGNNFTILELRHQTVASRWLAMGRDLTIAHSLCDRVDIQVAVITQGTAGEQVVTWQDFLPGIHARIQPIATGTHEAEDRRTARTTHTIFVDEPLELNAQHRAVGADGTIYRIVAYKKQELIGALAEIHVFADTPDNS